MSNSLKKLTANRKRLALLVGLPIALLIAVVGIVSATGQSELAQVRAATAQFHQTEAAEAAGYGLVDGLDHCFDNPGVGGMGYHYINTNILDLTVDTQQPEAMVYAPGPNGQLQLAAVEYIVPAADWDAAGNSNPPAALGESFHLNEALGVYVLHAWIWRPNSAGMFEDWNPDVSCP
ncbi:MAG: hypothetical protein L0332_36420 [Chloroflexi bacterium]|nr:hypothetical protein [Chloroflexota bacterium]MCI0579446.1 hypothetical protein [Chloroflexota bacterium]MCI0644993.1 hypothetical protein [Chloroflexota bacterium]MCI0732183.1 hypothetical protein [Chloroflexota bacterium]